MNNWKNTTLGEVINFRRGHDLPRKDMIKGNIPVVGSNGIIGYHNEYTTKSPCITIGRSGNVGLPFMVKQDCWAHNTTLYIDDYKGNNQKFIYYFLQTLNLDNYQGGSAVPTLNRNHIHPIDVRIPDIPTQRRIAGILSALDDKIENNRRICETLEQIAQAVFKRWFVDERDDNWTETTIGEVLDVKLGGTPATQIPEYWDGEIPWINSGEINKFRVFKPTRYITELGLKKSATKLLPKGSTLIAITGATLGQVSLLEIDSCVNQSVVGIIPNKEIPREYIYLWIKHIINNLTSYQTGGAQQHINKNVISNANIISPPDTIKKKFLPVLKNIFNQITELIFETETLIKTRDTLLPKLMSGELEV